MPLISQSELSRTLLRLPEPPLGNVYLYRIQSSKNKPLPEWIAHEHQKSGISQAQGRWFTGNQEALPFYMEDTLSPELRLIVLPVNQLRQWRVSSLPSVLIDGSRPQAFSRDPDHEFFVSRQLAQCAKVVPWAGEASDRRPRVNRMSSP